MTDPIFFRPKPEFTLGDVVTLTGAEPLGAYDPARPIHAVKPLDLAGPHDIAFFDNRKYLASFRTTGAGACLIRREDANEAPKGVVLLVSERPFHAFVTVARTLFEADLTPGSSFGARGVDPGAFVHPEARLEDGVLVDPGAVIGAGAEIGAGTVIGANAVIGRDVRIGRDCSVGPNSTVLYALIGDRVILHPGVRIGQDGFGFVPGGGAPVKVPQVGRVIVQDDVEIGAGCTIDRGAIRDTMIGEGTKIDNLVQIAHNVMVGRHCIIVAQTGISGSVTIEDHVIIGGQVGIADHLTIGEGARIGSASGVIGDIPPHEEWIGAPAQPKREFFKQIATLRRLATRERDAGTADKGKRIR